MKKLASHATLGDVAREAQVGKSTVSRVINGGARVSPETIARVNEVIRRFDYQPNHAARILKGNRTKTVGLIVPSVADSFFAICAEAAQEIARANDFLLIVTCSNNDPRVELENLNTLLQRRIDGLLLAPAASQNEELVNILGRSGIPVVCFDRPILGSAVHSVVSSNYKGAKEATRHLISHGYKRIVCLGMKGEDSLYTNTERIRGYRFAMQEARLPAKVDVSLTSYESTKLMLKAHLYGANPPDAIFAVRNLVTIYCFEALHELRVKIPNRVALLGFDDFELASALDPPITVVKQEMELMGKMAAELLFEELNTRRQGQTRISSASEKSGILWLDAQLIVRSSCGCGAAGRRSKSRN
jgi:LacI family transcriptional regulator